MTIERLIDTYRSEALVSLVRYPLMDHGSSSYVALASNLMYGSEKGLVRQEIYKNTRNLITTVYLVLLKHGAAISLTSLRLCLTRWAQSLIIR